jgi:hypothetical protein
MNQDTKRAALLNHQNETGHAVEFTIGQMYQESPDAFRCLTCGWHPGMPAPASIPAPPKQPRMKALAKPAPVRTKAVVL